MIDFPSNYKDHVCVQNSPRQQTAKTQKEGPSYWSHDPYNHYGFDPSLMPTRPEGTPMTPPSPLDQALETICDIQQTEQILEGMK